MLFVFIVSAVVYAVVRSLPAGKRSVARVTPQGVPSGMGFPYVIKASLLTNSERYFYTFLAQAVSGEMHIFSKVRLADLVDVKEGAVNKRGHLNRVSQKHVDFVLCAPESMRPMLVIELDDRSHNYPEAQARDQVKNAALAAAGLPILRVPTQESYQVGALAEAIRVQLRVNATGLLTLNEAGKRPALASGFVAVMRKMREGASASVRKGRKEAAERPSRKDSPLRRGNLRSQLLVPAVVILVVTVVFAQMKANSTNANAVEGILPADPLLTPQVSQAVDTPVEAPPSVIADTPVAEVMFAGDATVNVKSLNLRKGPGTEYESLGSFGQGTRLSLLGKDGSGQWANVRSAEGVEGWMAMKYVVLSVPVEAVPVR